MTRRSVLATIALVVTLTACGGTRPRSPFASPYANGKPTTLLTIGGSATEGDGVADRYRDAWPYLLFDNAFPQSTMLVNAALDDATVANAVADQLPLAKELKPQTVAIWLGADDLAHRTPIAQFTNGLHILIQELRAYGTHTVLVADLPNAYGSEAPQYDAAIRDVVAVTNATLVELQHTAITLAPTDGLPNQPSAASHEVIADAFEHSLKPSP